MPGRIDRGRPPPVNHKDIPIILAGRAAARQPFQKHVVAQQRPEDHPNTTAASATTTTTLPPRPEAREPPVKETTMTTTSGEANTAERRTTRSTRQAALETASWGSVAKLVDDPQAQRRAYWRLCYGGTSSITPTTVATTALVPVAPPLRGW
jgi:hypothetical protein